MTKAQRNSTSKAKQRWKIRGKYSLASALPLPLPLRRPFALSKKCDLRNGFEPATGMCTLIDCLGCRSFVVEKATYPSTYHMIGIWG